MNKYKYAIDHENQQQNASRLTKGRDYYDNLSAKKSAFKRHKAEALQRATAGQVEAALDMRSQANEIKKKITHDIRSYPNEPHMWSVETRRVAFGKSEVKTKGVDELKKEFEKAKQDVFETEGVEIEDPLQGLRLDIDGEGEGKGAEIADFRDNTANDGDKGPIDLGDGKTLENLRFLTNPAFAAFKEEASMKDCGTIFEEQRKKKSKEVRKGKLLPIELEAVESMTGEKIQVNHSSWIHYKEAPDEFKTMRVSMAMGKFKNKLKERIASTNDAHAKDARAKDELHDSNVNAKVSGAKVACAKPSKANSSIHSIPEDYADLADGKLRKERNVDKPPQHTEKYFEAKKIEPSVSSTIDWENAAASYLQEANTGGNELKLRQERINEVRRKKGLGKKSKVIMSIPWNECDDDKATAEYLLKIELQEKEKRHREQQQLPKIDIDYNSLKGTSVDNLSDFKNVASSAFDAKQYPVGTPIVDIGAADNLSDLIGWADTELKRSVVEISLLKDSKNRELYALIKDEEEEEIQRGIELAKHSHPARRKRVKIRHERERERKAEIIQRIRQENEMIVANRMAKFGLLR